MRFISRPARLRLAAAAAMVGTALAAAALPLSSPAQPSLSQLSANVAQRHARQQHLQQQAAQIAARWPGAGQRTMQHSPERIDAASQTAGAPAANAPAPSGWAIPTSIVLCESGGQNLPSSEGGPSGYYQITSSTWKAFGGSGSAAYEASRAEQDAVARRIWAGGSGAANWSCAGG